MNPGGDALATAQRSVEQGRWAAAKTSLERLLAKNPAHFEALTLMSYTLLQMDQAGPAIYYGQRALRCDPANLAVRLNVAACMDHAGDFAGTVRLLLDDRERVMASPRGVVSLSHSALRSRQLALAEEVLREGLRRFPDDHSVQGNLAQLLCESARPDEAIGLYHKAIALAPERMDLLYGLAVILNYAPGASARQIADAHLAWGRRITAAAPMPETSWSVTPDPDRPLRIGVFSSDLRTHAMAHFLLSWFEHFNPERVQLIAYSNTPKTDAVTARFRDRASTFREITRNTDHEFFDLVQKDRIDILIDTGGLTAGERMAVFARRPAPMQATWLGFPNTAASPRSTTASPTPSASPRA
jgi:predicted O-linked N-acetylglucosamine transferase (SPINDLY family)